MEKVKYSELLAKIDPVEGFIEYFNKTVDTIMEAKLCLLNRRKRKLVETDESFLKLKLEWKEHLNKESRGVEDITHAFELRDKINKHLIGLIIPQMRGVSARTLRTWAKHHDNNNENLSPTAPTYQL